MVDNSDNTEKTEAPTPHRLKKAKETGQVPRVIGFSVVGGLGGGILGLWVCWLLFASDLKNAFSNSFKMTQQPNWRDVGVESVALDFILLIAKCVSPFFITIFGVCLIGAYCSGGFTFSWCHVQFRLDRCNPIKGWQQWFSRDAWIKCSAACIKCLSIGFVFWLLFKKQGWSFLSLGRYEKAIPFQDTLVLCFGCFMVLISPLFLGLGLEVLYQRWSFLKKMRMNKQEIKEEIKREEGNPEIKAKTKQYFHQHYSIKTEHDLSKATLLLNDGTQYAVLLRYVEQQDAAPKVVSKGFGLQAKQLKQQAEQHGIPQVIAPMLTKQLFEQTGKGRPIPKRHYSAVAQLLAEITQENRRRSV